MVLQWINFVVGLWLIVSAFVGFSASGMATNLIIMGVVVAVLSLWDELKNHVGHEHSHA